MTMFVEPVALAAQSAAEATGAATTAGVLAGSAPAMTAVVPMGAEEVSAALSAAIQAHSLGGVQEPAPGGGPVASGPLLLDVTPRSLGVGTVGGYVETIIPRNTSIPTEQTKLFHPAFDNQTEVRVTVFQGESRKVDQNELLGEFILDGLRAAPRHEVRVEITFEIDADGIVHVIARDPESGSKRDLRIELDRK